MTKGQHPNRLYSAVSYEPGSGSVLISFDQGTWLLLLGDVGAWPGTNSAPVLCLLPLLCRWWRQVVQHLAAAEEVAEAYQQEHACRAAFQVRSRLSLVHSGSRTWHCAGPSLQHRGGSALGASVHTALPAQPSCQLEWH